MTRVAIIGAGPCGTAQLRAFAMAAEQGASIPELVCYEKQADWGGLWNYTWRTGLDQYGEPVHGSMYRYLWSNGPKECLEFADYTFEQHFGKAIPSYPPRAVLADYVKQRAENSAVRKYVRFNHSVQQVRYDPATEKFSVTAKDLPRDTHSTEEFDYVVCCSGHFSTPNVPQFDGFDTFNGRILHAHDFRDAVEFAGQELLLIGTSYSAEDIGSQCHKYGAKSVTISHRTAPIGFHWPDSFQEVPLLTRVQNKTAHFKDGSSKSIDAIILCTGYLHHFPFMSDDLRLVTTNRLYPNNLYKGVVWQGNPKLMYLGMQDQWYTFNMFDAQAWYARDVIMQRIALPSTQVMQAHTQEWDTREGTLRDWQDMIPYQGDYIKMLLAETDYPNFDVDGMNQTFYQWEHDKHHDIMAYRNNSHTSLLTGNKQPPHPVEWLKAMDDSMENYLGNG